MADGVGSDHPSVSTARGRLVRRGGTRRPAVAVPTGDGVTLPAGAVVRLVVEGRERHAPVEERDGEAVIAGAYENARRARERDGDDRLAAWVVERGLEFGRSVLVDEVEPGDVYGLRKPGESAVYGVERGPATSLRRIAEDLEL